jgi:hypothetical protein
VQVPSAVATIQAAIDAAPTNEMRIVMVAPGTYAGPIDFKGKPVIVRGTSCAQTIISGSSGQQLSVVRFSGGEPAIAALECLTVRGGLTGTQIPGTPFLVGGGIFGQNSAASVRNCVVENNVSSFGGGAYFVDCSGSVSNSVFRNNASGADGGGFQANTSTMRLTDVVVQGNTCNSRGGGMHLVQGRPVLTRVSVTSNHSDNIVGGLSWYGNSSPSAYLTATLCSVTGNNATGSQGGIGITDPTISTMSLQDSYVCNNLPRPNITGRWTNLGGNTVCDCAGDLNVDGVVNGADLGLMLSSWGLCGSNCSADLNGDAVVNGADLGLLLSAWGICG